MAPFAIKPGPRPSVAHATAVLVLSLVFAASIDPLRPIAREVQRETAPERAAVRELTATLAKAVRSLCGSPTVKPVALAHHARVAPGATAFAGQPVAARDDRDPPRPAMPRVEWLDLPPPARA